MEENSRLEAAYHLDINEDGQLVIKVKISNYNLIFDSIVISKKNSLKLANNILSKQVETINLKNCLKVIVFKDKDLWIAPCLSGSYPKFHDI